MKTRTIIATLLLTISVTVSGYASGPKRVLTFQDALGRKLSMPVKVEEAQDTLPFDACREFHAARSVDVNRSIDISGMSKPEKDADDISIDLEAVYHAITQ